MQNAFGCKGNVVLVAFMFSMCYLMAAVCFNDDLSNDYLIKPEQGRAVLFYDQLPNGAF